MLGVVLLFSEAHATHEYLAISLYNGGATDALQCIYPSNPLVAPTTHYNYNPGFSSYQELFNLLQLL